MTKIIDTLKRSACGKIVFILIVITMTVYLTMICYTIPIIQRFAPSMDLFDLSPAGYSYEEAISLLTKLGTKGQEAYLYTQLPLDFIYPGLFAISYSLFLTWLFKKGFEANSKIFYLSVIPIFAGLFDYLENIGIIVMIKSFPNVSANLVFVVSSFTILKSIFTMFFFILLLFGIIKSLPKR